MIDCQSIKEVEQETHRGPIVLDIGQKLKDMFKPWIPITRARDELLSVFLKSQF